MQIVQLSELRDRLTANEYEQFRRVAIMKCLISNATWSNWVNSKCIPEDKYKPIIDGIAAIFGFTVFGTKEGGGK